MGGKVVALLEARRSTELAGLVETYGGVPRHAPALREEPVESLDEIAALLDGPPIDVMVFQTGVGARALFRGVEALGRTDELKAMLAQAIVAVRGPKPTAALKELGVQIDARAEEPFTTTELLASLADRDLEGKRVVIQQFGEVNAELTAALEARGAAVVELEVYRWALPEDTGPLESLFDDLLAAKVDALVVTSQVQVRHLFEIASRKGLAAALPELLYGRVVVAAVGPVAAKALREHGIRVDLEPEHPKMGPLVRDLASLFERATVRSGGGRCPD